MTAKPDSVTILPSSNKGFHAESRHLLTLVLAQQSGADQFKPNTHGAELASDLIIASKNIFTKTKGNALTCEELEAFIQDHAISDFYITGADATACVKSTCYNLRKENYNVFVLSDCITSYDKKKIEGMLRYYESKGNKIIRLNDFLTDPAFQK